MKDTARTHWNKFKSRGLFFSEKLIGQGAQEEITLAKSQSSIQGSEDLDLDLVN